MKLLLLLFTSSCFCNSCNAQPLVAKAQKIYDSRIENYIAKYRRVDPDFFNNKKRFWIQIGSYSILGLDEFGIKYTYNFDTKDLKRIRGLFGVSRKMSLRHDFTGAIGFNFYLDETIIGWLVKSSNPSSRILRFVDFEQNFSREVIFDIPQSLQEIEPVIVDTTQLLFNNYIVNIDGKIDTLKVDISTAFPSEGDKIFMRKQTFMIDKYFEQKNPNTETNKTSPIDYNRIEGNRLVTQKISSTNIKTVNYRVETSHGNIWLLSHKSNPEKFCLYDTQSGTAYPFELDKAIFNLNNLSLAEPVPSSETAPGRNVIFSYLTSMNNENIYIYQVKNGITLFKVLNYKEIMR